MSTQETTVEPTGLSERLRTRLALVPGPAQLRQVPQQLRQVPEQLRQVPEQLRASVRRLVQAAGMRLRTTLDLPTGTELQELLVRVEELDRRLAKLQRAEGGSKPKTKQTTKKKVVAKTVAAKSAQKKPNGGSAKKSASGQKTAAKKSERPTRTKKIAERAKAGKKTGRSKR